MPHRKSLPQFAISFALAVAVMLPAGKALADFTCGAPMKTYRVTALDGRQGAGVRCVLFAVGARHLFAWYGEGFWGRQLSTETLFGRLSFYRHIGESGGLDGIASAADIHGNGEHTDAAFSRSLQTTLSDGTPPSRIEVRGAWNEVWTLEPDNVHHGYTRLPELRRVQVCGKNFVQYEAIDRPTPTNHKNGFGVRCLTKRESGFFRTTWYGEGQWNDVYYAHVGSFGGAADICEPSLFGFCGNAYVPVQFVNASGGSENPPTPARYIRVAGAWREDWVLNDVNPCCAVAPAMPPSLHQ